MPRSGLAICARCKPVLWAVPMDVNELGADFLVCAGYKWLLSPYGTGFFWAKSEHLDSMRPGPFYWTAQGAEDDFFKLNFVDPAPLPQC